MVRRIAVGIAFLLFISTLLFSREPQSRPPRLAKSSMLSTGYFNPNQINTALENNGMLVSHRLTGSAGMEWPAGEETKIVYASGLWVMGRVNGQIRGSVAEYGPEFLSGPYGSDGSDPSDRLYVVNVNDLNDPLSNPDFAQWPTSQGAPWVDVDDDGVYTPLPDGLDYPDFIGDQVLFYVMNDGTQSNHSIFNTEPLGLEIRVTMWGYDREDVFGDMLFTKAEIHNLGGQTIEDAYFGIWSDPDIGNAGDDYVGCDPERNLGYAYNAAEDNVYGFDAPAVGYDMFQTAVPSRDVAGNLILSDMEYINGVLTPGYKNLPMSSFLKFTFPNEDYFDPNDALEAYNYMSGHKRDGTVFINPALNTPTTFIHPGDPTINVNDSDLEWVDADEGGPGDRRFLLSAGPTDVLPNDHVQMTFGVLIGRQSTYLHSVSELKRVDDLATQLYQSQFTDFNVPDVQVHFSQETTATMRTYATAVLSPQEEVSSCILYFEDEYNAETPFTLELFDDGAHGDGEANDHIWANDLVVSNKRLPYSASLTINLASGENRYYENYIRHLTIRPIPTLENWEVVWEDRIQDQLLNNDETAHFSFTIVNHDGRWPINEFMLDRDGVLTLEEDLAAGGQIEIDSHPIVVTTPPEGDSILVQYRITFDRHVIFAETTLPVTTREGDIPEINVENHASTDASLTVTVVNPDSITGDRYNVYFSQQHYYLDADSIWQLTNYPDSVGRMAKSSDISASVLGGLASVYGVQEGTYDLIFTLDFNTAGSWADGIQLDLPDEMVVNSWSPISGEWGSYGAQQGQNVSNWQGSLSTSGDNIIYWGSHIQSGFGGIEGDVMVSINVNETAFPFQVDYEVWDDGYDSFVVDATGTITISEIGYQFKSENRWNLYNTDTDHLVLANQRVMNGVDYYTGQIVGDPIADGLMLRMEGTFELPATYSEINHFRDGAQLAAPDIQSWGTIGWAADDLALNILEFGSNDYGELGFDYEIRWTGAYNDTPTLINGVNVYEVSSGGSMATLYGARVGDLAEHPLNPHPGDASPFLVRIPFEVWNKDTQEQINFYIYDRIQNYDGSMDVYPFNPNDRMYTYFVNTPYNEAQAIPADGGEHADHITWNLVFWSFEGIVQGDVVEVKYTGPITLDDYFTFSTAPANSDAHAGRIDNFVLAQNFPNPFNPTTHIRYRIVQHNRIRLTVFDILGKEVTTLDEGMKAAGNYELTWEGLDKHGKPVGSGVYFARLEVQDQVQTIKMLFLK